LLKYLNNQEFKLKTVPFVEKYFFWKLS